MTAFHETDDLTYPRCGTSLAGLEERADAVGGDHAEEIRIPVEYRNRECSAPLAIVIEPALPEALGVDVWIEDRREKNDN